MEIVFSERAKDELDFWKKSGNQKHKTYCRNAVIFLSFILFVLSHVTSTGQTTESIKLLKTIFTNADSIILISHVMTVEYSSKEIPDWDITDTSMNMQKWKALHPVPPKFLINGKLNRQIIRESVSLDDSNRIRLSNILLRKVLLNYWAPAKCDQPQHAIIFYKNNNQSYIDICFGCGRIHSSKDIAFDEMNVDKRKWAALLTFFKTNGLTKVFQEYERLMNN